MIRLPIPQRYSGRELGAEITPRQNGIPHRYAGFLSGNVRIEGVDFLLSISSVGERDVADNLRSNQASGYSSVECGCAVVELDRYRDGYAREQLHGRQQLIQIRRAQLNAQRLTQRACEVYTGGREREIRVSQVENLTRAVVPGFNQPVYRRARWRRRNAQLECGFEPAAVEFAQPAL